MIFNQKVNLFVLADIISQNPEEDSFVNIQNNSINIVLYNISIFLFSGIFGYLLKKFVRTKKLDRNYKFFRFQNSWHYILKGEFFDFPRADISLHKDTVEDIEFVFIDALYDVGGESYIYDGILVDYELNNKDIGLETISITNAQRRKISDDSKLSKKGVKKDNSNKFYPIDGHILVLKYSELKNLNFTYYTLDYRNNEFTPRLAE